MTESVVPPPSRPACFDDVEQEFATTRRVLERVPDEHWEWTPHEKSMTLGRLSSHLLELVYLATAVVQRDSFDPGADRPLMTGIGNRDQLLRAFDEATQAFQAAFAAAPADAWRQTWQLTFGGQVFVSLPRAAALRLMGLSHPIHHRGQLTVFLRLLGVPVPSVYGPSADEPPFR
jgi:uncharacterized damage-inducible protein DinB